MISLNAHNSVIASFLILDGIGYIASISDSNCARFKTFDRKALGVDSDYINSLYEDIHGNILIGTDRGLVLYNPISDTMHPLDGLSCRVYTMCGISEGRVCLGVKSEGLYIYDAI